MQLNTYIDDRVLMRRPELTRSERESARILGRAARRLQTIDPMLAKNVFEALLGIFRKRFGDENNDALRRQTLGQSEWTAICEYFPYRYAAEYFTAHTSERNIRRFIKLANRSFVRLTILGCGQNTDYVVLGYLPNHTQPTILARMYVEGGALPVLGEIVSIVESRRSQWRPVWPCMIGLIAGALAALLVAPHEMYSLMPHAYDIVGGLGALAGMGIGWVVTNLVNTRKRQSLVRRFPHLTIRC